MMKKINPYLLTIILALCFLIFTIFARVIMNQTWEKVEDNEKETVVAMVHSRSNHVFDQLNSFYAFVETHKNDEITLDEFNTFSSELMKNDYGVVNYSIAIAGIQEYVYPLEGNEDVLGHNLLEDDREEVVTAVTTAINTGEMTYNGPYPMRTNPDKSIMVFRYPVYNDDGTFYAIINTVIETDKLFINGSEKVDKNKIYDIEIQTIEGVTIYGSVANNDNATEFYSGSFDWIIILDYQESYVKQINLIKNFLNLLFLVIIISIIWSAYLFSKRNKKLSIEIDKMIYYDRLTNLPNRRKLETFFENHPDKKFSLAFADIDDFKYLNDTYGHELGDQALKEISQKFLNALGESVYRWGGDEFIFIIEGDDKDVRKYLERIIEAIKKPLKVDDDWFSLTISIGVLNKANDYETLFDSVKLADMAMYAAKKSGKNQYVFYNSDQGYQLSQFVKFDQMSKTIDFDTQSALYFQPQYSFKTDRIIGIEALFRIEFDDGCVLPKGFIGAAEKNGSIKKLDQYVLLKAIEYHQILQDRNFNIPISVNVSGKTISKDFIKFLEETIEKHENVTSIIQIELTEGVEVVNSKKKMDLFMEIKKLGFKIIIDDFGKQYSNYDSLNKMNIDVLKIDKDFIMNMDSSHTLEIVKSIVKLTNKMNIEIVAEGVETKKQYTILKNLDCDSFQGYLYSRPLTFTKLLELLKDEKQV